MLKEIIGASLTSPLKGGLKTQKQVQTCTLNKITTPTSLFVGGAFFHGSIFQGWSVVTEQ